jgi:hypothetical protein
MSEPKPVEKEMTPVKSSFDLNHFIKNHLIRVGIEIDPRYGLNTERTFKAVREEAFICYRRAAGKEALGYDLFKIYFDHYLETEARMTECDFKGQFAYSGADLSEVAQVVKCLQIGETYVEILAHWMWSVKSSMFHPKRPKYVQLMPILVSQQGFGKSTLVNSLIQPLEPYSMHSTVEEIVDSRVQIGMCQSYAVFLDEMAKLERTSMSALKRVLTMSQASLRSLYSNSVQNHVNKACFIGASNKKLIESIYDPTGMRRFIEIEMSKPIDWELLKEIDFMKAWQSVDESRERGYIEPVMEFVKGEQANYVDTEVFDDFLAYYDLKGGAEKKEIGSTDLYKQYRKWCISQCYGTIDHKPFSRKLVGANLQKHRRTSGAYYFINARSSIWEQLEGNAEVEITRLRCV